MAQRVTRTGSFELPLNAAEAIGLFTAEGERTWIPGWVPEYPQAGAVHDALGTVFIRREKGGAHLFVVVGNGPLWRRYARITESLTAGVIDITCDQAGPGTRVRVMFDLTALSPAGAALLDRFGGGYEAMLSQWREWIVAQIPTKG